MPLFRFKCSCGQREEFTKNPQAWKCAICGEGERLWDAPKVMVDFKPGWDAGLGRHIETQRERDRILAEKGLLRDK
jgi:hypothetical protein